MQNWDLSDLAPKTQKPQKVDLSDLAPKSAGLLDSLRQSLEPDQGEGIIGRSLKGIGRTLLGVATMPMEIAKSALVPPQSPEETLSMASTPQAPAAGLMGQRMIVEPAMQSFQQAKESWEAGHPVRAAIHGTAGLVPLVGPWADSLIGRAEKGDIAGATTEAATGLLLPKGLKAARAGIGAAAERAVTKPLVKVLGGGEARMAETPKYGGPAASTGSRAEVADYAASRGIDLLPGQATESRPLQAIQSVGERSLAGEKLSGHIEQQRTTLAREVDRFKNQAADPIRFPDRESIGANLQDQTRAHMESLKEGAQQDFKIWREQTGDIPIKTEGMQQKYRSKLGEMKNVLTNTPERYAGPIRAILDKASKFGHETLAAEIPEMVKIEGRSIKLTDLSPKARTQVLQSMPAKLVKTILPEITVSDAQQLRTAFWEIAHDYEGNIPKRVNAIAAEIVQDLDNVMENAAKSAGTLDTWRLANKKWTMLQEYYNTSKSPLYRILQEADPSKVPAKLLMKGEIGGSPRALAMARAAQLDLKPLKRQVIQDIAEKGFGLGQHGGFQLGGYSHEFLSDLFTPTELMDLYKMGRVARAVKFELNPSGTSNVMNAREEMHGIIRPTLRTLTGPAAVKFTLSPAVKRLMTGGRKPPRTKPSVLDSRTAQGLSVAGAAQENRLVRDMNAAKLR